MTKIAKDSLVMFSTGSYSDYGVQDIGRATKDLDLSNLEKVFKSLWEAKHTGDRPDGQEMTAWLFANGYFIPVDFAEAHMGDYGDVDIEIRDKGWNG